MPLEPPILDARTYDEILRDLRLRIPQYTPDWTDFNESDPGITLLELFAWLTEGILVQMNRVPERSYRKFLQLVGLELRPAQPATAHLEFTPRPGATILPVPVGAQIGGQPAQGGDLLIFETEVGLDLIRVPLTDVQVWDGNSFQVFTTQNQTRETPFRPLGWAPQLGNALYLGFTPPEQPTTAAVFPQQLRLRIFLPVATTSGKPQRCQQAPPPPPVDLVWEYRRGPDDVQWQRLSLFTDESAAFTRDGYMVVQGPVDIAATRDGKGVDEDRFWLRCRLERGSYPTGIIPEIDLVRPNTVPARNLATVADELVGTSNGRPNEVHRLRRTPALTDSLKLETQVGEDGEAEPWTPVPDFLESGPTDRHYVLNVNTGEIRFGDGERGRIPVAASDILARVYRYGGGRAGNVGPDQLTTALTTLVGVEGVTNPYPAVGGQDEQSVEDLKARAPREIRRRNRAVTPEDFTSLTGEVGGIARATTLPLVHPDHPGVEVPGTVTVVVVPDSRDPRPEPSPDLLRAVCAYLEQYRLLTTELFVQGPQYQTITVRAHVTAQPYVAAGTITQRVTDRLRQALDPLHRPFGIDFHPTSLYSDILGAADVVSVESLEVFVDGLPRNPAETVTVPAGGLLAGGDHQITVTPAVDR